jgi:hypothetical protein
VAAHEYAKGREMAYIAKRGGQAPVAAASSVYHWAFRRFMDDPEARRYLGDTNSAARPGGGDDL